MLSIIKLVHKHTIMQSCIKKELYMLAHTRPLFDNRGRVTVRFFRNSRKTKDEHGQNGQKIRQNGHRKTIFKETKN